MRLTQIAVSGEGVKGRRFHHGLTGVDVFYGPNGAGKSSRLLAILGARLGFADVPTDPERPYIGEKPGAAITVSFSDGASLFRSAGEGARSTTFKVQTGEFERRMGPSLAQVDLSDLMREPEGSRHNLLKRVLEAHQADVDPAEVIAMLSKDGEAKVALNGLLRENPQPKKKDLHRWMNEADVFADEKAKHWNAQQRELNAVVKQGVETIPGVRTVPEVERDLEAYRRQLAEAEAGAGARVEILKGREAHEKLGNELSQGLANLDEEEAKAKAVTQECRGRWAVLSRNVTVATAEHGELVEKLKVAQAEQPALKASAEKAINAVNVAATAVATSEAGISLLGELCSDSGLSASACKDCGAEDPLDLTERRYKAVKLLERQDVLLKRRQAEGVEAQSALDKSKQAVRQFELSVTQAKAKLEAAQAALQKSSAAEDEAKAALERLHTRREAIEGKLRDWQDTEPPSVSDLGEEGDEDLLRSMTAKLKQLEAEHARAKQAQAAEAKFLENQTKRDQAVSAWKAAKALKAALVSVRAWMDQRAYAPLVTACNEFLSAGEYRGSFYISGPNDFGLVFGEKRVVFWALSDSEKAMCGLAMTYAMAVCVSSPWKGLVVDNLERLDETSLGAALGAALRLHAAGRLDNFVGAIVHYDPDGELPIHASINWIKVEAP